MDMIINPKPHHPNQAWTDLIATICTLDVNLLKHAQKCKNPQTDLSVHLSPIIPITPTDFPKIRFVAKCLHCGAGLGTTLTMQKHEPTPTQHHDITLN
jgi:hypothetical protein